MNPVQHVYKNNNIFKMSSKFNDMSKYTFIFPFIVNVSKLHFRNSFCTVHHTMWTWHIYYKEQCNVLKHIKYYTTDIKCKHSFELMLINLNELNAVTLWWLAIWHSLIQTHKVIEESFMQSNLKHKETKRIITKQLYIL